MKKPIAKKLVCIADMHCGHRVGLTPPNWQWNDNKEKDHIWQKFGKIQKECWNWYESQVSQIAPVDVLVVNGDAIDGRGERSGGVELITGDRNEQIKMAVECIEVWKPKQIVVVRGTPYHTGEIESFEDTVSYLLTESGHSVKVGDHEWVSINGVVFDFKHYIGGSQIPHGRKTALMRDVLWNEIWSEADLQPKSDWIVRSHVHYCEGGFSYRGGRKINAVITPALQAMGTRFGARQMSGLVDFGFLNWTINEKGIVCSEERIANIQYQKAKSLIV